ncbi:hypothetical protein L1049_010267 [Liquidambar formosana]|uniref:Olee1-like protein n=1 Tax=Liquidambar formosana TaxID=63359 RepID=A0AAP0N9I7_LIQFO
MARSAVFLLAAALCFSSLLGSALSNPSHFTVEGLVYCDTCRAQFVTKLSEYMEGAKVRLECRNREGGDLTYSVEGETDKTGTYQLGVDGEHENEVCEIVLVKSSKPDCSEISTDTYTRKASRISLTSNNGMVSGKRLANPLGFMKKEALPECSEVLKELGILSFDTE